MDLSLTQIFISQQRAKNPIKQSRDRLIEKSRVAEDHVREITVKVKQQRKQDLHTDFETNCEKRFLASNVKNRVKTLIEANECSLECRREK